MMKKRTIIVMVTLLFLSMFPFIPSTAVKAESVTSPGYDAEVTSKGAELYNNSGNVISNVQLAYKSDWKVGETLDLGGKNYYQVSTDEFLSSSDGYLYQNRPEVIRVGLGSDPVRVYDHKFDERSDLSLAPNTYWYSDQIIYNGANMPFVRVSTDAFVSMTDVTQESFTE